MNSEIATIFGGRGSSEEVDMSYALGRGIYAMKLGAEDGGAGEPHQSLDSKADYK